MDRICSMIGCNSSNAILPTNHFFQFPRDFNLCLSWVESCKNQNIFEDFTYGGALPCLKRFICFRHFNPCDFIDAEYIYLGLKPNAVPHCLPFEMNQGFDSNETSNVFIKEEVYCADYNEELESAISNRINNPLGMNMMELDKCLKKENDLSKSLNDSDQHHSNLPDPLQMSRECTEKLQLINRCSLSANQLRQSMESEAKHKIRKQKNALRAAYRRRHETEEQRQLRQLKDKMRSAQRRQRESEVESKIRKYNDAVRAAFRRSQESTEQKMKRRMHDMVRAANRRSKETLEQRQKRLKADRERIAKRRRAVTKICVSNDNCVETLNTSGITDEMLAMLINNTRSEDECDITPQIYM